MNKTVKRFIGFSMAIVLFTSIPFAASAASFVYYTDKNHSSTHSNGDNKNYFMKTEYHIGTTAPWDDAYIYVESGAPVFKRRKTHYDFGGAYHDQSTYSAIGSGVQSISDGYEVPGTDYATGVGVVFVLSGSGENDPIAYSQSLTVTN